jgi:hypothetical protein
MTGREEERHGVDGRRAEAAGAQAKAATGTEAERTIETRTGETGNTQPENRMRGMEDPAQRAEDQVGRAESAGGMAEDADGQVEDTARGTDGAGGGTDGQESQGGQNGQGGWHAGEKLSWRERVPLYGSDSPIGATCKSADEKGEKKISRESEEMLIRAKKKPLALTALYSELGLSGYKGGKAKDELIRAGLVFEVALPTNRWGPKKKLLQVTPKGTEYLKSIGITTGYKGRGGVKHLYYQKALKDWYQNRGYTVEVEATVGHTCVDVLVIRKDGERLGIEIALSEQYEEVHARKAMEAGLERLMFVCETEELVERLGRKLSSLIESWPGNKPGFKLISDYLTDD